MSVILTRPASIGTGDTAQTLVISATNVDADPAITGDSVLTSVATEIQWMIQVRETVDTTRRRARIVHAMTDGTSVDFSSYGLLTVGAAVAGLSITVDISAGLMRLRIFANNNIDYVIKRLGFTSF